MKKIVLFLVVFSIKGFSQEYRPLLDNYNEWHLRYCFNGCSTDIYFTDGDTIVDGQSFKVLDGFHYISRSFLLREDVQERKVYLKAILPNGIKDYLLYDFSLEVGDSIDMKNPITPYEENAGYYKVDEIALLPLEDGSNYRHYYLSPTESNTISTNDAIWVEGVGSLSLINAPSGDPDVNEAGRIGCMFKNGVSFYSDLEIIDNCEATILSNPSLIKKSNKIKIIKLSSNKEYQIINLESVKMINLYAIDGSILNTFNLNNQDSLDLDLSSYPSGIYFLNFTLTNNQKNTLKFIVY